MDGPDQSDLLQSCRHSACSPRATSSVSAALRRIQRSDRPGKSAAPSSSSCRGGSSQEAVNEAPDSLAVARW